MLILVVKAFLVLLLHVYDTVRAGHGVAPGSLQAADPLCRWYNSEPSTFAYPWCLGAWVTESIRAGQAGTRAPWY